MKYLMLFIKAEPFKLSMTFIYFTFIGMGFKGITQGYVGVFTNVIGSLLPILGVLFPIFAIYIIVPLYISFEKNVLFKVDKR